MDLKKLNFVCRETAGKRKGRIVLNKNYNGVDKCATTLKYYRKLFKCTLELLCNLTENILTANDYFQHTTKIGCF